MSKVLNYFKSKNIIMPLCFFLIIFCGVVGAFATAYVVTGSIEYKNSINSNFKPEYATYVDFTKKYNSQHNTYYIMYYEFEGNDGRRYTGEKSNAMFSSERNAKSMVGQKTLIFVDQNTHEVREDLYFHQNEMYIIGIVAGAAICIFCVALVYLIFGAINRMLFYVVAIKNIDLVSETDIVQEPHKKELVVLTVIMGLFAAFFTFFAINSTVQNHNINTNVINVEATITEYQEFVDEDGEKYYKTFFEYANEDVQVKDVWATGYRVEAFAKSRIGTKVTVCFNKKTKEVTRYVSKTALPVAYIMVFIFLSAFIYCLVPLVFRKVYLKHCVKKQ